MAQEVRDTASLVPRLSCVGAEKPGNETRIQGTCVTFAIPHKVLPLFHSITPTSNTTG